MIVAELDVKRISVEPPETEAPLIVDAEAVLSSPVPRQQLQAIAWRHAQKGQRCGSIEEIKLSFRPLGYRIRQALDIPPGEQSGCSHIGECLDHVGKLTCHDSDVKRHYWPAHPRSLANS
jgi:hypothetical protein